MQNAECRMQNVECGTTQMRNAENIPNSEFRIPNWRLIPALVLVLALLLQGCFFDSQQDYVPAETIPPPDEPLDNIVVPINVPRSPGQFTLRYDPSSSLNPIMSLSSENIILSSLLYESLFALDGNLNIHPVLCESWSTENNVTYTFNIKPDIAMNDGSTLTADDVAYTLRQAMQRGRFVNRLRNIRSISSDGDLTLTVVLRSANSRFIYLLDVPVIKDGSIDDPVPPGTGPYEFTRPGSIQLTRFVRYRDYSNLPVLVIHLRESGDNELTELFDNGELSLIWDDPADSYDIRLNRLHETRFYNTTALQFIGFNTRLAPLRNPDVRRAIGVSIERDIIVSEVMPGQSLGSPLALSPAYRLYRQDWEPTAVHPLREMSVLLESAGLVDDNEDTFLQYPEGGEYVSFTIDFIVNSENMHKVRTAQMIASGLRRVGINVAVRELPWPNFINALESGNFDMFYGETVLSADFDLSPLLLANGSLNFGGTGRSDYALLIENFLSAQSDYEEQIAAGILVDEIRFNAPFVPVLYKRYAVYTPMAAISDASPSQSAIFRLFPGWSVDLSMLT